MACTASHLRRLFLIPMRHAWNKGLTKEDAPQLSRPKSEEWKAKMRVIMKDKTAPWGHNLSRKETL